MTELERPTYRSAARVGVMLLLVLSGCSTTKSNYPGATEQLQQQKAEAAASDAASNAVADSTATYLKLVEQMQRDGLWFASLAHIDALEQRWGASPDSMRMRADALRQTEQPEESRKLYAKLMGTPLEAAGYRGLGLLAGSEGDYPQAVRLLEQAQRRTPTDGVLLSDLGYAQMRAGSIPQARVPLMQALQLAPDNTQVQANAALYLQVSGQPAQADALMESSRMNSITRAAIQDAALGLSATPASTANSNALPVPIALTAAANVATTPNTMPEPGVERQPLALKTASWPRRVHVLVRPQAGEAVAATGITATTATADAAEILPPPSSIGAKQ